MGLTWGTLIVGAIAVFGVPTAVVLLNRWKPKVGWWFLATLIAAVVFRAITLA